MMTNHTHLNAVYNNLCDMLCAAAAPDDDDDAGNGGAFIKSSRDGNVGNGKLFK